MAKDSTSLSKSTVENMKIMFLILELHIFNNLVITELNWDGINVNWGLPQTPMCGSRVKILASNTTFHKRKKHPLLFLFVSMTEPGGSIEPEIDKWLKKKKYKIWIEIDIDDIVYRNISISSIEIDIDNNYLWIKTDIDDILYYTIDILYYIL